MKREKVKKIALEFGHVKICARKQYEKELLVNAKQREGKKILNEGSKKEF